MEPSMIHMDRPELRIDQSIQESPGAFIWWYLDLVDDAGRTLVLIWSFGLPFLPGYVSSARRGSAQLPSQRPSFNLVYNDGSGIPFYLLEEYEAHKVEWDGSTWRFGNVVIRAEHIRDRLQITVDLDCPIPGTSDRLTGSVRASGNAVMPLQQGEPGGSHAWTPLMAPGDGRADLRVGDWRVSLAGEAYHDRNRSRTPWHNMGIRWWLWGRQTLGDTQWIYYLLWPDDSQKKPVYKVLSIERSGHSKLHTDIAPLLSGRHTSRWGAPWWKTLRIDGLRPSLEVEFEHPTDASPFYLRTATRVRRGNEVSHGSAELCFPHRVDTGWFRPFVQMCVHKAKGPNSWLLPLFCGPRATRLRRWKAWLSPGRPGDPLPRPELRP